MPSRDVDLLDLIVDHHDEPRNDVIDDRHDGVADALCRSYSEGLGSADFYELVRDVPFVAISPAAMPDLRDGGAVRVSRGPDRHRSITGA